MALATFWSILVVLIGYNCNPEIKFTLNRQYDYKIRAALWSQEGSRNIQDLTQLYMTQPQEATRWTQIREQVVYFAMQNQDIYRLYPTHTGTAISLVHFSPNVYLK